MLSLVDRDPDEYRRATQQPRPRRDTAAGNEVRDFLAAAAARVHAPGPAVAAAKDPRYSPCEWDLASDGDDRDDDDGDGGCGGYSDDEAFEDPRDEADIENAAARVRNRGDGPPVPDAALGVRPEDARPPNANGGGHDLYLRHRFVPLSEMVGEDDLVLDDDDAAAAGAVDDAPPPLPPLETLGRAECFLCQFDAFPAEYTGDEASTVSAIHQLVHTEVDENGMDDRQVAMQVYLMYEHAIARPARELRHAVMPLTARGALAHIRFHRNGSLLVLVQKMMRDNDRLMRTLDDRQWEERPDDSQPRLNAVNVATRLKVQTQTVNLVKTAALLRKQDANRKGVMVQSQLERLRVLSQFRTERRPQAWQRGAFARQRVALLPSDSGADAGPGAGPIMAGSVQR